MQDLLLGETTALYTLSLSNLVKPLLLLLIGFVGYFHPIFLAVVSVFLYTVSFTCVWLVLFEDDIEISAEDLCVHVL
jgi:hypothetical protein